MHQEHWHLVARQQIQSEECKSYRRDRFRTGTCGLC